MRLRHKEPVAIEAPDDPGPTVEERTDSPLRRWWVPRAIAIALWVVMAASVAFAVMAWARPVASSGPATVVMGEEARWDVSGFAELFVSQYVDAGDGDEASLALFMGNAAPASLTMSSGPLASRSDSSADDGTLSKRRMSTARSSLRTSES